MESRTYISKLRMHTHSIIAWLITIQIADKCFTKQTASSLYFLAIFVNISISENVRDRMEGIIHADVFFSVSFAYHIDCTILCEQTLTYTHWSSILAHYIGVELRQLHIWVVNILKVYNGTDMQRSSMCKHFVPRSHFTWVCDDGGGILCLFAVQVSVTRSSQNWYLSRKLNWTFDPLVLLSLMGELN